jgi:hypothetical protein
MLVLDMTEILPPLGKYKYDTWRILPVKCYIDNSARLRSCIKTSTSGMSGCFVCPISHFSSHFITDHVIHIILNPRMHPSSNYLLVV